MSHPLVLVCRVPETTPRLLINKEKSGQQVRLKIFARQRALVVQILCSDDKVSGSFHINFFFLVYQVHHLLTIVVLKQFACYVFFCQ